MWIAIALASMLMLPQAASAADPRVNLHGRLLKNDGTPVAVAGVQFQIQIVSAGAEACVLYQETQTQDMMGSAGVFTLGVNDGTGVRNDATGIAFPAVFANRASFTGLLGGACGSGNSYAPSANDPRKLIVSFNDGTSAGWEALPTQTIGYVPTAIQSLQVASFPAASLMRVEDPVTGPSSVASLTPTQFSALIGLSSGTSTMYIPSSTTGGASLPSYSTASPADGAIWYDTTLHQVVFHYGASNYALATSGAGSVTSMLAGRGLSDVTITSVGTLSLSASGVTLGTYGLTTGMPQISVDTYGRVTSAGTLGFDEAAIATGTIAAARLAASAGVWSLNGTSAYYGGGNVGVGTTSPQTALQVAGVISPATDNTYTLGNASYRFTSIYATNATVNTSVAREKKDIETSDFGLDFITKLRPVSYHWKNGIDTDLHYGLIAQETEKVVANLKKEKVADPLSVIVAHDKKTDRYGIKYTELISPIIKSIQEFYGEFKALVARVSAVEGQAAALKANDLAKDKEIAALKAKVEKSEKENVEMKLRLERLEKMMNSN